MTFRAASYGSKKTLGCFLGFLPSFSFLLLLLFFFFLISGVFLIFIPLALQSVQGCCWKPETGLPASSKVSRLKTKVHFVTPGNKGGEGGKGSPWQF
jgi:hypothetical protein